MEVLELLAEGQVAEVQDAHRAVVVAGGQHQARIGAAGGEGHVQRAGFHAAAHAHGDVAHAQLEALVHDGAGLLGDDLLLGGDRVAAEVLIGQHVHHLLGAAQTGCVGLHGGDAHGLVGGLDDDLGGLGEARDGAAHGDHAEGLGLVRREAAHPLVQHGGDHHVAVTVLGQVFLGQLLQGADGGHVLHQVAALAVAHGDVLHALLGGQQRLDDGGGVGDAGGNQRAGERAVGLAVDGHAHLLIQAGQAVDVLPVLDGALHGDVLAVGQVVGDAAALVAGEAAGVGDFGQQPGVGGSVAHLHGHVHALDDLAALGNAVVHRREAVEHGAIQAQGLVDAVLRLLVAVLAGVAVDGGGQQVGLAELLQVLEQLDVALHHRHACAGLDQRAAILLGGDQLLGEDAVFGHRLMIADSLLQVDILAGRPLGQYFLTERLKFGVRNLLVLYNHRFQAPFS